jgi:hypothetical protein
LSPTDIFFCGSILLLIGWLIVPRISHRLTADRERKRDMEARRRNSDLATSDFTAILKKWLDLIGDRQQVALAGVRTKSIPEIEQSIRMVRIHLDESAKSRIEDEWKKYQSIDKKQLDGIQMRHQITGSTIISYDDARRILSDPLKKMLEIVHPSGAFQSADDLRGGPEPDFPRIEAGDKDFFG